MEDLMQAHPWQASGFSVVNRFVGFDCNWGSSRRWGFGDLVYWREVGVWLVNWLLLGDLVEGIEVEDKQTK
jgi:hypothetical protein